MFFFGIFSTTVPLVVLLAIYVLGFFSGAFLQKDLLADGKSEEKREICYQPSANKQIESAYHFSDFQKISFETVICEPRVTLQYCMVQAYYPPGNEFIYNLVSNETLFSRPPPVA
jgi:hypothetical protein